MQKLATISVRLPAELKRKVERKAASDGCAMNGVIIRALECHLRADEQVVYKTEARRQSQLAAKLDRPDTGWEKMVGMDFSQERADYLNSLPIDPSPLKR